MFRRYFLDLRDFVKGEKGLIYFIVFGYLIYMYMLFIILFVFYFFLEKLDTVLENF